MTTTTMLITELVQHPQAAVPVPAESWIDKGETLAKDFRGLLLIGAGIIAILLVCIVTWKAKTLAALLSSAAIAAGFVWVVHNVSDSGVQDPIDDTINNNGAPASGGGAPPPISRS